MNRSTSLYKRSRFHVVHAHQEYNAITLEHLGVDVDSIEERSLALRRQGLDRLLENLSVAETHHHLMLVYRDC